MSIFSGSRLKQSTVEELWAWLFVLPAVLGIVFFEVYPTLFSFYISFTNWNLLSSPQWVALNNYIQLLTKDRTFYVAMSNTLLYTLGTVPPGLLLSLIFAVLLNQKIRGVTFFRAIYFLPVIVPSTAMALLWSWMYDPSYGVINSILKIFGITGPPWITNTHWALTSVSIEGVWASMGLSIVIYLAGLQSISNEYYEAAMIDGANPIDMFFRITIPLISPVTFFLLVTGIMNAIQVFDIPYVMTAGGPGNATLTIIMDLYRFAFQSANKMGMAAAMGYLVFILIVILTVMNLWLEKKWVYYEG